MILGFTGTRMGMVRAQHESLRRFIRAIAPTRFVHGDGGHADALAHAAVEALFPKCYIEVFPSNILSGAVTYFGTEGNIEVYPPMDPLDRNRLMVRIIHGLVACPQRDVEDWSGSGTWATVRYAREIGVPTYIIQQSGKIIRDSDPVFK